MKSILVAPLVILVGGCASSSVHRDVFNQEVESSKASYDKCGGVSFLTSDGRLNSDEFMGCIQSVPRRSVEPRDESVCFRPKAVDYRFFEWVECHSWDKECKERMNVPLMPDRAMITGVKPDFGAMLMRAVQKIATIQMSKNCVERAAEEYMSLHNKFVDRVNICQEQGRRTYDCWVE